MTDEEQVATVLKMAIILVLILIVIVWRDIKQSQTPETFVNEQEKLNRAGEVIGAIGDPMKDNPKMSFDQSKTIMPTLDAVEYKDVKGIVNSGGSLNPQNLASNW